MNALKTSQLIVPESQVVPNYSEQGLMTVSFKGIVRDFGKEALYLAVVIKTKKCNSWTTDEDTPNLFNKQKPIRC